MKKETNVRTMIFVAMLGVVSTILMTFNFSIPLAPGFLKFDIAEIPALFAGFFIGPVGGIGVIMVKIVIKIITQGTDTAFVGEMMNVMGSVCFVLPASLIYRWKHTKKGAVIGMTVSSILVSIAFIFINMYIAFPLYSKLYGMPMDAIIGMGTAVNPHINNLMTLMLFSVFPFNLIKHGVTLALTYLIYKRAGNTLRNIIAAPSRTREV